MPHLSEPVEGQNTAIHRLLHRRLSTTVKELSLVFLLLVLLVSSYVFYSFTWVEVPSSFSTEVFSPETSLPELESLAIEPLPTESPPTEVLPAETPVTESAPTTPLEQLQSTTDTGFLPLDEAQDLCAPFNWSPYPNRTSRRKIYDLVLIDAELDWLEIRMNEYKHEVDHFVIIEATKTFTQNPKPLNFRDNFARFQNFFPKIIYHVINYDHISGNDPWERERYSRNALFELVFPSLLGPNAPQQGDVILVSDADELPRRSTLSILRNCDFPERTTLRTKSFKYSFQWLWTGNGNDGWWHPQATYYQGLNETILPEDLRMNTNGGSWDLLGGWAGWHCSYCFETIAQVIHKLESVSHTEANVQQNKYPAVIVDRIRKGLGIFEWNDTLTRVDMSEDLPEYLVQNHDRFEYMLDRDPENANFRDYSG